MDRSSRSDQPRSSQRLWLLAGTGEGPALARCLLERGWHLRVSVVSPSASHPFPDHPHLEMRVGALAGATAIRHELEEAERQGAGFRWLIDASHPFATRVTAAAVAASQGQTTRLLRLRRPQLSAPTASLLSRLDDLAAQLRGGERILLAIGSRHLAEACRQCAGSLPHARVLPHPQAIRQALQAGLAAQRIACLRPTPQGEVERALCRHWRVDTIVCRQSGGATEAIWQRIAAADGQRLLLLKRPEEPAGIPQLGFADLVEHVGWPDRNGDGD